MRFVIFSLIALIVSVSASTAAAGETRIGSAGTGVNPFVGGASEDYAGQIFTVPAGVSRIDEFGIALTGTGTFILGIVPEADAATTNFIAQSSVLSISSPTSAYQIKTVRLPEGGVPVTPGQTYLLRRVVVSGDPQVVSSGTDYYAGGEFWFDGIWGIQDDTFFTVGFDLPLIVPTLTEWAMIVLGLLMAADGGVLAMRRRARA